MRMVDRKLLVEYWQQIETELVEMEKPRTITTVRAEESWWESNTPRLIKGLYRAVWCIMEYIIRRDKA